ncbi:MAG TPA: GNAT family N-acetyltransferase [bacterium]|jgi:GNAT superfamily N-acetyltransferase|nr:GNAT family N-acetyltransferase [bacterium]
MKIPTLEAQHVPPLLELWSRRWGDQFPLDLALWRQNTEGDPRHFRPERCWVIEEGKALTGCLVLKTPDTPPAWPGQDPRQAWISFLALEPEREPELAAPLLDRALGWLRGAGFERVVYGGDPCHFFPGAPEDDSVLCRTLETGGFRAGQVVHDLLGDLHNYDVPDHVSHSLQRAEAAFGECSHSDAAALLEFVDTHFPGRWAYETRVRLAIESTPAGILAIKRGAEVIGFCHVYHRGSRRIGPSIYWRRAIGNRYGGLGPMGVAPGFRGRGLGLALFALAVEHLRRLGVERAVVDWTTLLGFYGRLGFRVWRSYRSWRLDL